MEGQQSVTLQFSREQARTLENLAEIVRAGGMRDPNTLLGMSQGGVLSHGVSSRPRVFMHVDAARLLRDAGRKYLGGKAYADFSQLQFAQPTLTDVHVDALLTQMSISYHNPEYIGDEIFPRVQVVKESDKYFKFDKGPWLRDDARMRAPGTKFPRGGYTLSQDSYSVDEWGFECPVDDRIRNNSDNPLSPDRNAADFVADKIDLKLELKVASLVFTAGNWSNSANVTNWNSNGGNPFTDFSTARITVNQLIGRRPNTIVMGAEVYEQLALHEDLIDRIKYTGTQDRPAMVTSSMLAALFGVEKVLIGTGVYSTSLEPTDPVETFIWGKNVWIGYVSPRPALENPSAGYIFTTGRYSDRYREEDITSDIIRAREAFDEKVTSADSGYLMTDAVD